MATTALSQAYPLGTTINERGHLEVGGCDVVELAERYGTPAYIYAEDDMRARGRAGAALHARQQQDEGGARAGVRRADRLPGARLVPGDRAGGAAPCRDRAPSANADSGHAWNQAFHA